MKQENLLKDLIHVGKIVLSNYEEQYLLLYKEDSSFTWHQLKENTTEKTEHSFPTTTQALMQAYQIWGLQGFSLLRCGFRYTLPERDEVGSNALFNHMVTSYNSMTGSYFDQELGHLCRVDFASDEAIDLWKRLATHGE